MAKDIEREIENLEDMHFQALLLEDVQVNVFWMTNIFFWMPSVSFCARSDTMVCLQRVDLFEPRKGRKEQTCTKARASVNEKAF